MRFLQKANSFINRVAVFDHMKRTRFGDKRCVEAWILAGEIEFADDGGGGNLFGVGGGRSFFGESETEGKNEGGGR